MISTSKINLSSFDVVFESGNSGLVDNELINAGNVLCQWITPKESLQKPNDDIIKALEYLPEIESQVMEFYKDSVRKHFIEHIAYVTLSLESKSYYEDAIELIKVAATLKDAQKHYYHPLNIIPFSGVLVESFDRMFKSLIRESISYFVLRMKMISFFIQNPIYNHSEQTEEMYKVFCQCGLIDESEKILAEVAILELENYCHDVYKGVWDVSILDSFKLWMRSVFIPSLENLLIHGREGCGDYNPDIESSTTLIEIAESFVCDLRTKELFDIVLDFPNSLPAINDLKLCLKKPSQRASVVSFFQKSCSKRLLQGGANTVDIISAYISTVQVFTKIDAKGVLLEKVSRPIRRYLKDREDTIAVLVSGILGQENSEIKFLSDILAKPKVNNNEEIDDLLDMNWYPDPIDAPVDFIRNQSSDIIDSLISLYENKDVFVKEIVSIFADRMLSDKASVNDIILFVEMLKLRFGERELQNLDVMVKDMNESKRINGMITNMWKENSKSLNINSTILSRLFWPTFRNQSINLPRKIEKELEEISESFSKLKRNRRLMWLKNLGQVTIELEFEDRIREFTVNSSQATAITIFESGNKSLKEFMNELGTSDESFARSLLTFWINKGILIKQEDVYKTVEKLEGEQEDISNEEIISSSVQSAEERTIEEMKVYWSYIVGMLTNLGSTPISRIHSFLKVLVPSEINYTKSQDELERYLNLKVEEDELEFVNGNYKLKNR